MISSASSWDATLDLCGAQAVIMIAATQASWHSPRHLLRTVAHS